MTPSAAPIADLPVNILVVDDEPANLLVLETILDDLGRIVKADSGEEALRRVLAEDFAVILLDVRMQGLDGFETAKLTRGRPRSRFTPIVFITGYDSGDFSVRQAYALGAVDYLVKPLVPEILRAKVITFVELFRKSETLKIRTAQQAAVAQLSQRALADMELTALMKEAVASVAHTLRTDQAGVWELLPGAHVLRLRAVVGAAEPLGPERMIAGVDSQVSYTLQANAPVTLEDLRTEARFHEGPSVSEQEVVSGLSTVIRGRDLLVGVLSTYTTTRRTFSQDDVHFLQAVANVLAAVVERKGVEEQTRLVVKELRQTTEELTRSNRELEQFAYVASHDLKEPLRKITLSLELLERRYRGRLEEEARQFLTTAVDGAKRLRALVNDLLAYARVGSRANPLKPTRSEEALGQALANLQTAIQESGAQVSHGPLPWVRGDAAQLVQLFQNLIDNAIKFRRDRSPVVQVEAHQQEREWVFSVRDNGIGIAPDYHQRIFIVFERLHNTGEYPGTGVGLAICKKIVERHGGRIWVESKLNEGATFCFSLPITEGLES
jgi:signal transduction histidine kinase